MTSLDQACVACGKGGNGLKTCTACKLVKYCNATCQLAHRPSHKKECTKRAAELHDEALFKQPPPRDECPVCFHTMPLDETEARYKSCCGKRLCLGCCHGVVTAAGGANRCVCPFCRAPIVASVGAATEGLKERVKADDAIAIYQLACNYYHGKLGLPQDSGKAIELYLRAGELGDVRAYFNLGHAYRNGEGVERDEKKARYYWELAAMGGDVQARHNLGSLEGNEGNAERAMKHWMISAMAGSDASLKGVREGFMRGHVTKVDFERALRAHQSAKDEMKSDQRDKAAAVHAARGRN